MILVNEIPLRTVLIIGFTPSLTQLALELSRSTPEVTIDLLVSEEFIDNDPIDCAARDNLHIIKAGFDFVIKKSVTKQNLKTVHKTKGKYTLGYWTKDYLTKNLDKYDFIISTNIEFQRWTWFQNLKNKKPIFCCNKVVSDLEHDKLFCKQILVDAGIPTPTYQVLNKEYIIDEVQQLSLPAVVKCDLAFSHQGFGSWVFHDESYQTVLPKLVQAANSYNKSSQFYTEDFVSGPEISAHFLCNGYTWEFVGAARDYKKRKDGDEGMNTAGTGSYAPAETWTDSVRDQVYGYMDSLMSYLKMLGIRYMGIMYLGIIVDDLGVPQVLEINTRPGTPEFLAILKTIDTSNLLENMFRAVLKEDLLTITPNGKSGVAVALMHKNYSPDMKFDSEIPEISSIPDIIDYNPCAKLYNSYNMHTILSTSADTRQAAADILYEYLDTVDCKDYVYRTDIGYLK